MRLEVSDDIFARPDRTRLPALFAVLNAVNMPVSISAQRTSKATQNSLLSELLTALPHFFCPLRLHESGFGNEAVQAILDVYASLRKPVNISLPATITRIPSCVRLIPRLEIANHRDLTDVEDPPLHQCRDMESMIAYFEAQLLGTEQLRDFQCILLGDGQSGKSLLARVLRNINSTNCNNQTFFDQMIDHKYIETRGIETSVLSVPIEGKEIVPFHEKKGSDYIEFNVWDFAGQVRMLACF